MVNWSQTDTPPLQLPRLDRNTFMSDQQYYVRFRGRTLGPFSEARLQELIKRGQVTRMHEISVDSISWQPADAITDFFGPSTEQRHTEAVAPANSDASHAHQQPVTEQANWYANLNNENKGPVTKSQLSQWIASGAITAETLVWREGKEDWEPANVAMPEFFPNASNPSYQAPVATQAETQTGAMKNCPFCTQIINSAAIKCPHCQSMLNKFCSNCGKQCAENQDVCLHCGTTLNPTNDPVVVAQPTSVVLDVPQTIGQASGSNLTTTSIILSCIGLFCFGIILCPIALVLAIVAMNKGEKNALVALILSIVIFIPSIFLFFAILGGM